MSALLGKSAVREWILARNPRISPGELSDNTPILGQRMVTSLQLMDLILFLESLRNRAIEPDSLRMGAFDSVDSIWRNFLMDDAV